MALRPTRDQSLRSPPADSRKGPNDARQHQTTRSRNRRSQFADRDTPCGPHPRSDRSAVTSDDDLRAIVARLARRHPSGGTVIERAAILAEGPNCTTIIAWITAHDGKPEAAAARSTGGLHGARLDGTAGASGRAPVRYVLPASALA